MKAASEEKKCEVNVDLYSALSYALSLSRYGDGAGNTIEENSSVFSLIRMR